MAAPNAYFPLHYFCNSALVSFNLTVLLFTLSIAGKILSSIACKTLLSACPFYRQPFCQGSLGPCYMIFFYLIEDQWLDWTKQKNYAWITFPLSHSSSSCSSVSLVVCLIPTKRLSWLPPWLLMSWLPPWLFVSWLPFSQVSLKTFALESTSLCIVMTDTLYI